MEQISSYIDNDILYICLKGHIDSSNAAQAEEAINAIRAEHPEKQIILDAEQLEYISSAGLRVVLRLLKQKKDLQIINVSSSVYEILEMTGFTEMLPVKKAYRRLSVEGCTMIGRGANGAVYRYDEETIVKYYFNPNALPEIHHEREMARKAFILGINTAIPYDIVRVGDGYGAVAELLNAESISRLLAEDPENIEKYAGIFIEMLKKIHSTELKPGDMPDMKQIAVDWADFLKDYLPEDQWEKLHALVAAVPERNTMLHGDYHSCNVMVQNNETLLIDMDTLCMGHPIFELASMFNAFVGFSEVDHETSLSFLGIPFEMAVDFWKICLKLYLDTEDEKVLAEVEKKAMVIGYTRMMRRAIRRNGLNTPDGQVRINRCKEQLEKLLKEVDTLDF